MGTTVTTTAARAATRKTTATDRNRETVHAVPKSA